MKNMQAIRRVLYITMVLNLAAMMAKLGVGYWTGALSLVADGFDSLLDAAGNVIGLVGIYLASRPADEEHPYGHRKFETLTAIGISLLLFVTTWELLQTAWERLRDPASIDLTINAWSFGSLLLSIAVHIGVVIYELNAGRRYKSDVLVADAMHTRADIFISVSVIVGLFTARLGYPIIDPLLALGIAVLVFKIGVDIIRESSRTLLDGAVVPISEIERVVLGVRDVRSCHYVRSRGHEDAIYVDLHIQVAPEMTTAQSHAVAHDVQHRLRAEIPSIQDVVVHVEPARGDESDQALIPALRGVAEELGIAIHDITARSVGGGFHVDLHMTANGSSTLEQAHGMADRFEELARDRVDHLSEITTHLEPDEEGSDLPRDGTRSAQDMQEAVRTALNEWGELEQCHEIQVHPVGDDWSVTVHCTLAGTVSLREAHTASSRLEARLRDSIPRLDRVTVHTEPGTMEERVQ